MVGRNAVIGQSGGPTAVINSSLYGVITEWKRGEAGKIYGAVHGVEGMLKGEMVDLTVVDDALLEGLKYTPGAALGGCRYMLKGSNGDTKSIFDFFDRHGIGYFFYIGGNDSMDTANKIYEAAKKVGYELKVIGIPKTIDNDLVETHHCPGFGSAAKYVATSVMEAGIHAESMATSEPITILTTVGRNTGWLPKSTILARKYGSNAPHLVYVPEVPVSKDIILADVERVYRKTGWVFIVTGEGLKDDSGEYIGVESDDVSVDAFGHPMLGSVGEYLKLVIERELKLKTRTIKLDICQQSAMHFASLRDRNDAILVGKRAVELILDGITGVMVTLGEEVGETATAPLSVVANKERELSQEYVDDDALYVEYVKPLIVGEVKVPIVDGLPKYVRIC
ncbi:MAG: 6-phosphofructokinase [Synergistetes bacterium]|nr:6-phosphofructokinase [Synergistota bacterium]